MVKEHHRFLTEWYKGSNNIRSLLGSGTKGQTTSDVCYGVVQRVKQHQMFVTETKQHKWFATSDICYGVLQRVKGHHRFVTEWYKWSKKITGFLLNGTKGQTTSEVC